MGTETDPEILYHYCSNDAFLKIVGGKSLWLSDITMSNDTLEGEWLLNALNEHPKLNTPKCNTIADVLNGLRPHIACAFCLSEQADSLGQWRAYAHDGSGIAIGFSRNRLLDLLGPVTDQERLIKVKYGSEHVRAFIEDNDASNWGVNKLKSVPIEFFGFKHQAFEAEAEWRILAIYQRQYFLTDYTASHRGVRPHVALEFSGNPDGLIRKIILGPKNETPNAVVESFLRSAHLEGVTVERSEVPYR